MKRDEEMLPSTLYERFKDNDGKEFLDHESLLLNLLSLLSTLGDIAPFFRSRLSLRDSEIHNDRDFDVVAWIFKNINHEFPSFINCDADDVIKCEEDNLLYEWYMAMRYIHDLLQHITPFELHFLASQTILLSEGLTISHQILCLLLFAHALNQCPKLLEKRCKRWQSLTCETLRIFQDLIRILNSNDMNVDSALPAFSLFINHIVPSCLHVIEHMPLENTYHVALFSGLVGTTSNILQLVVGRCQEELFEGSSPFRELLCIAYDSTHSIISSFDRFGCFSENSVWIETMRQDGDKQVNRNQDVDFWMHRDSLSWWVYHHHRHEPSERIANMDTSFHNIGLGLLAMKAFQERPMVYDPIFLWTIWFPHVVALFSKSSDYPSLLQNLTFQFLETLIEIIPGETLVLERTVALDPHLELFYLLSCHLMGRIQTTRYVDEGESIEKISNTSEEAKFEIHSQRTAGLIKALLTRFTTTSQVKVVEKVMQNCATPCLRARFLDLLRPLISKPDISTEKFLWKLLVSILDNLFKNYWNRKEKVLKNVDVLMNQDVEIFVGAITMIQVWSLVKKQNFPDDRKTIENNIRGFSAALQKLLCRWSEDTSLAPKFHYRLFLLDSALQNAYASLVK